jgi:hypothetical protein
MARTNRKSPHKPWKKEKKSYRRANYKKIRRAVRMALQSGLEPAQHAYRTEGWLTH